MQKRIYNNLFIVLVFLVSSFFATHVYAASFYFTQSPDNVITGDIFTVQVYVGTAGENINLAEGTIHFPTEAMTVLSVDNKNSDFTLWPEDPSFSNADGTINFSGGIVNPGYSGDSGKVFTFTAKAKKTGSALMSFSDVSLRANDGLGTNLVDTTSSGVSAVNQQISNQNNASSTDKSVLPNTSTTTQVVKQNTPEQNILPNQNLFTTSINISPFIKSIDVNAGITKKNKKSVLKIDLDSAAPVIISDTHPDQSVWYKTNDIHISLAQQQKVLGVQASFSSISGDRPVGKTKKTNEFTYNFVKNGISYFNARYLYKTGWSQISTYAFHVDNLSPEFLIASTTVGDDGRTKILLKASDSISGIDHFTISNIADKPIDIPVNNGVAEYLVPPAPYLADYNLNISVMDLSGNVKNISFPFAIKTLSIPKFADYSKEVTVGKTISVSGVSDYTNRQIAIYVKSPDQKVEEYLADTDSSGHFKLETEPVKLVGDYKIWMQYVNERGERSYESAHVGILSHPQTSIWQDMLNYINENMSAIVSSIVTALIVITASIFIVPKFIKRRRAAKK